MTYETTEKTRPMYRVSFSRITGQDQNGKDILGPAREIGAIWARKAENKEGGILQWDHIPIELPKHNGVTFITPVKPPKAQGPA